MEQNVFSFKKIFLAYLFFILPFSILESFLAYFNVAPVDFNGIPRYGFIGAIIPILFIPFLSVIISGATWVALTLGTFFYNGFMKIVKMIKGKGGSS